MPKPTDMHKLKLWTSIRTPCLPTQAFSFQTRTDGKIVILHLCAASSRAKMAQNHSPHLCCAMRSLQSYDDLSRLFGTQIVICGYIEA